MIAKTRQPTFADGWRNSPGWLKVALAGLALANIALAVFTVLTFQMAPMFWIIAAVVNVGVVFALMGTVTDVFAAPPEQRTAKMRSLAIGIGLVLLVVTFFAATLIRLGGNVFNRAI